MAEDAVLRKPAPQRALERIHVVDALADERALVEEVLVDVGDGARVRVDAGVVRAELGIARAVGARQVYGHARLQDAVAVGHDLLALVVVRAVQGMRQRADELAGRVARQLRVGIQRDHVLHLLQHRGRADDQRESLARAAAQQLIEVAELAALALIAHPEALLRIPAPRAMQEEERLGATGVLAAGGRARAIFLVEDLDARARQAEQRLVFRLRFLGRVAVIGEQGELQVRVAIGEEADFERLDQLIDGGDTAQHRRHHHQRAPVGRDAALEIQARQEGGVGHQRDDPVDECDRKMRRGQRRGCAGRHQQPFRQPGSSPVDREERGEDRRQQRDAAQIGRQRHAAAKVAQDVDGRQARLGGADKVRKTFVDQVEAHVRSPGAGVRPGLGLVRKLDRLARNLDLGQAAEAREALHHVPVPVARGEIHRRIDRIGILAQLLLHRAHAFDELAPVHRAEEPQAADAVADRHLVGRLALRFRMDELLDGRAGFGEALFDPRERQRKRGALTLQAARELGHERAAHRRVRARHVGHDQDQAFGVFLCHDHHLVGPGLGLAALEHRGCDARAHPAQVLDQRKAQHDRDRPQLAEAQVAGLLVGRDETVEAFGVDAPVAVSDRFERDVVDARQAARRAAGEDREFAAVALGEMPPRGADLLFDQVEVIEQPFAGRGDAAALLHRRHLQAGGADQHALVLHQALEQPVAALLARKPVRFRQRAPVPVHLVGAEQLRAQRWLGGGVFLRQALAPDACAQPAPQRAQGLAHGLDIRLQDFWIRLRGGCKAVDSKREAPRGYVRERTEPAPPEGDSSPILAMRPHAA